VAVDIYRRTREDDLSLAELALYHAIMDYRASVGLAPIPLSRALTTTAGRHVADTRGNVWAEGDDQPPGGLHGWSDARYRPADPHAMREAPTRLGTGYPGEGHEISAYGYPDGDVALAAWQRSPGHDALLAERGGWADPGFAAIGVGLQTAPGPGIYAGRVFHVWFGEVADPTGAPTIRGTGGGERIAGTRFADRVAAGGGDDSLLGGAGHDRLFGQAGNDRLVAGPGRDFLNGGAGADTFVFDERGLAGRDRIRYRCRSLARRRPIFPTRRRRLRRPARRAPLRRRRARRRPGRGPPRRLRHRARARAGTGRHPAMTRGRHIPHRLPRAVRSARET
jgi:hypothetical protein